MGFSKYRILIYSENPDELIKFYQNVLEFKLTEHLDIPGDYGYQLQINGDLWVWIGKHSEIKGKAKENFRHLFNLTPVEGVEFWYNKIKNKPGVTIVAKPFLAPFSTPENQVWFC